MWTWEKSPLKLLFVVCLIFDDNSDVFPRFAYWCGRKVHSFLLTSYCMLKLSALGYLYLELCAQFMFSLLACVSGVYQRNLAQFHLVNPKCVFYRARLATAGLLPTYVLSMIHIHYTYGEVLHSLSVFVIVTHSHRDRPMLFSVLLCFLSAVMSAAGDAQTEWLQKSSYLFYHHRSQPS